jgi:hypothetical protein
MAPITGSSADLGADGVAELTAAFTEWFLAPHYSLFIYAVYFLW